MKNQKNYCRSIFIILLVSMLLSGCQKTPEKSAVASKANGLSKDVIAKPLENGEKRTLDIPEHWQMSELKSNDRVTISADLEVPKMEVGNLPVIEMCNHELTQKELKNLISYFAKDEALYVPEIYTKDMYQNILDRIEKKEGGYDGYSYMLPTYQEIKECIAKAVLLAPQTSPEAEKAQIKFQKQEENPALDAAAAWWKKYTKEQDPDAEVYFSADVGKERNSHITAETYDTAVENSSSFTWMAGAQIIGQSDIQSDRAMSEESRNSAYDLSGYVFWKSNGSAIRSVRWTQAC